MKAKEIKEHFARNKQLYLGLGIGLAVGAGAGAGVTAYRSMSLNASVRMIAPVSWKPHLENNQIIVQSLERRGHPGFVVRCNETGETFASIRRAAEMLNVSRTHIANHLKGDRNQVGGYTFTKLGEAVGSAVS